MKNIVYILIVLSLSSCKKDFFNSCISAGDNSSKLVSLDNFTKLDIQDRFKIYLIQDSIQYIEIKGKKNLIEDLSFIVKDGTLTLEDNNRCKLFKGYHTTDLLLHFETLEEIKLDGNSELYSTDTLNLQKLFIESHADMSQWDLKLKSQKLEIKFHAVVGKMKITGETDLAYIYTSGSNHLFFKDLICQRANVNHSGLGNIHITTTDYFTANINKYGNIYCYGQPNTRIVKYGIEGTGSVFYDD